METLLFIGYVIIILIGIVFIKLIVDTLTDEPYGSAIVGGGTQYSSYNEGE